MTATKRTKATPACGDFAGGTAAARAIRAASAPIARLSRRNQGGSENRETARAGALGDGVMWSPLPCPFPFAELQLRHRVVLQPEEGDRDARGALPIHATTEENVE